MEQIQDKVRLLAGTQLFSSLTSSELEQLALYARRKKVADRQVIFHKGESGQRMFIIAAGRVKVSTYSQDGREIVFGILDQGELFGELAVFDGGQRTATVSAIAPCELLVIERREFFPFLEAYPRVAVQLLGVLSARLRTTDELFEDVLFLDLSARLAKKLLALGVSYGQPGEQGLRIGLRLSQQELANLVGASRESVNRLLRTWEAEDLIRSEQGHIILRQTQRLQLLADACA